MDSAELINKLRGWANDSPAHFLSEFEPLYKSILRKDIPACKCPDKIRDAVLELYSFINKHQNNMDKITNTKARLRMGCVLYHVKGFSGIYTNANLTDDVARAFIEQRPDKKNWFETLPDPATAEPETVQPVKPAADVNENAETVQPVKTTPKKRGRKPKK